VSRSHTVTTASAAASLLLVAALAGAAEARTRELMVSAAVSMKDAVEEIARRFAAASEGAAVRLNLGASGELARQIEAGAPVDVFVSASAAHMDDLERRGRIEPATRRAFAGNRLVVVVPADARARVATPDALAAPAVARVAIGNPRTVPAGRYAEESLRALGLLERLRPKLVYAETVRQALEWVARGEIDAAWVYATDAAVRRGRVKEAFRPPEETYGPVVYPAAVVRGSDNAALARGFVEFLGGDEARAVLARLGFLPPPPGP
jgi:molybdate transport system substrate-binding protein